MILEFLAFRYLWEQNIESSGANLEYVVNDYNSILHLNEMILEHSPLK